MDIEGASTADGAKNIQWTYTGANNQQWKLSRSGDFYTIVNRNSGKYLDISDASLEDGWPDIQWKANGGKNQLWELCRQKGLTCVDNSIVIPTNVFYDPRAQRISVTLNSGMNRSGWIVLADVDGRYIEKKPIKNHSVEFSTVKLLRGIYVVNIISDQEESYKILL